MLEVVTAPPANWGKFRVKARATAALAGDGVVNPANRVASQP